MLTTSSFSNGFNGGKWPASGSDHLDPVIQAHSNLDCGGERNC